MIRIVGYIPFTMYIAMSAFRRSTTYGVIFMTTVRGRRHDLRLIRTRIQGYWHILRVRLAYAWNGLAYVE
jgi:hypothetical protein